MSVTFAYASSGWNTTLHAELQEGQHKKELLQCSGKKPLLAVHTIGGDALSNSPHFISAAVITNVTQPSLPFPPACNAGFPLLASCLHSSAVERDRYKDVQTQGTGAWRREPQQFTNLLQANRSNTTANTATPPLTTACTMPHTLLSPCCQQTQMSHTHRQAPATPHHPTSHCWCGTNNRSHLVRPV